MQEDFAPVAAAHFDEAHDFEADDGEDAGHEVEDEAAEEEGSDDGEEACGDGAAAGGGGVRGVGCCRGCGLIGGWIRGGGGGVGCLSGACVVGARAGVVGAAGGGLGAAAGLAEVDVDGAEFVVIAQQAGDVAEGFVFLLFVSEGVEHVAAVVARQGEGVAVAVFAEFLFELGGDVAVVGEEVGAADVAGSVDGEGDAVGVLRGGDAQGAVAEDFNLFFAVLPVCVGGGAAAAEAELGVDVGGLVAAGFTAELGHAADAEGGFGRGCGFGGEFPDDEGFLFVGVAGVEAFDSVGQLPVGAFDAEAFGGLQAEFGGQAGGAGVAEVGVPGGFDFGFGGDVEGFAGFVGLHAGQGAEANFGGGLCVVAGHGAEAEAGQCVGLPGDGGKLGCGACCEEAQGGDECAKVAHGCTVS